MAYPVCPKCGHAPLPADQSLPAACPACGIVLAKFSTAAVSRDPAHEITGDETPQASFFIRWLLYVPPEVSRFNWYARMAAVALFLLYTIKIFRDTNIFYGDLGGHFLSMALLPWHEAGHVFFRPFGQFMMSLGGTLGQHLFPIILGVALLMKRRDSFGAALAFWLLGYSVIYTGWYMHDAGDPQAMMVSGKSSAEDDGHDFVNIFSDMGGWWILNATKIGVFVGRVGQAMMCVGLVWAAWLVWLQKAQLSDSPFAEATKKD
jgi:hypothetical protein